MALSHRTLLWTAVIAMLVAVTALALPRTAGAGVPGSGITAGHAMRLDTLGEVGSDVHAAPAAQGPDDDDDELPSWFNVSLGIWQLIIWIALVIAGWKLFEKAGRKGWLSLIPIVNTIVVLSIVGRPWWWILLYLIPIVGFIFWLIVSVDLAKSFGRSTAFGIFLLGILNLIGMFILGFGNDQYRGAAA